MSNCVVVGCSNSYYTLQRWLKTICHEHNEKTSDCGCCPPFQLFPFPTVQRKIDRQIWIKSINRKDVDGKNWQPKPYSRVCSKHFVDKTPTINNPYPTLDLGYIHTDEKVPKSRKAPLPRAPLPSTSSSSKKQTKLHRPKSATQIQNDIDHDHSYKFNYICNCVENCQCKGCIVKQKEIEQLKRHIVDLTSKIFDLENNSSENTLEYKSFIKTDKNVKRFLGLPNKAVFKTIVRLVTPKARTLRYWKGSKSHKVLSSKVNRNKPGPSRKLNVTQELTAVFIKLRLNLTNEFIAHIFGISPSVYSQIFSTWIKFLAYQFQSLIYHPTKEEVKASLPKSFRDKVPTARSIIDCSEFFLETPNSLDIQSSTWSEYKHHNTLKCLIDITPTGIIQFISPAWGGRTSDKFIVLNSGYLDTVEKGDTVLADRGFPIAEELLLRGAKLYIPPGARGMEQMTQENVVKTKKVANLRIHVERAINRLKWFRILSQTIPISIAPLIDDILIICAAVVNLYPPLVK